MAAVRRIDWPSFWRGALCCAVALWVATCSPPARAHDLGPAFATATSSDRATVTLHLGRGPCVGDALAAVWRPPPGDSRAPVLGCWVLATDGAVVLVSFLDGERGNIPAGHLVKVRSL